MKARLENINQLRYLLYTNEGILDTLRSYAVETVIKQLNEMFNNIHEFNYEDIYNEIKLRRDTMNLLLMKYKDLETGNVHLEFSYEYQRIFLKKIYFALYSDQMDSEDKRYARRSGAGGAIRDFREQHKVIVTKFLEDLNKRVKSNKLKTYEQAEQYVSFFINKLTSENEKY